METIERVVAYLERFALVLLVLYIINLAVDLFLDIALFESKVPLYLGISIWLLVKILKYYLSKKES